MSKIVTVTLMRQGSKRLPGKNLKQFAGKPLYQWTIEAALQLGYKYAVFHNYDKLELPDSVEEHRYTGQGLTMDKLTCLDADIFVMLPATSPIRDMGAVKTAATMLVENKELKCVFAVKKLRDGFYYNGYADNINFTTRWRTVKGYPEPLEVYRETGSFYVFRRCQIFKPHILDCASQNRHMIPDRYAIDIDSEEDFTKAERYLHEHKAHS